MSQRKYYHAYDDRYKQVHDKNLVWFGDAPSEIVETTIKKYAIDKNHKMLEIGCGEGRDAFSLLKQGFNLLATDVSPTAISFCQSKMQDNEERFRILDCITDSVFDQFNFIYAVAVLHMLVPDSDRNAFYRFIYQHLTHDGLALICTMGDGIKQHQTDVSTAFDIQNRIHEPSNTPLKIANTSCRIVNFTTFTSEIVRNHLTVVEQGITSIKPDFPQMMYAVVRKEC